MNDKELFAKVRDIISSGWYDLEIGGTGAPGNLLEDLLDLKTSNLDTPDAGRWEIKFCSGSSLLTLFHKTPRPRPRDRQKSAMRYMIDQFGREGSNGRPSFRHTIEGRSTQGFYIEVDSNAVWVRHPEHTATTVPHWTQDDLLNAAGGKLRRLIVVMGKKKDRQVCYTSAMAYQEFRLSEFMSSLGSGLILVDFDAYLKENGAVRDHGTKFRVRPDNLSRLYQSSSQI